MTQPRFLAAFGKTDYFKNARGRMGFWDFFVRGIKPYGYLFSLPSQGTTSPLKARGQKSLTCLAPAPNTKLLANETGRGSKRRDY